MNLLKKIQHYLSLAIMISLAFEKSFSLWIINLGKTLWFSWLKSNLSSRTANLVLLFFGTWNGCQGHSFTVVPILRCYVCVSKPCGDMPEPGSNLYQLISLRLAVMSWLLWCPAIEKSSSYFFLNLSKLCYSITEIILFPECGTATVVFEHSLTEREPPWLPINNNKNNMFMFT